MNCEIKGDLLNISIDGSVYNEDVLFKCFYWYGKTFSIEIDKADNGQYLVKLQAKEESFSVDQWDVIISKVKQDLIDFKLRDIVTKETKTIRELIIAKAFAYYEEDSSPSTNVSDPVGFNPENITLYE